MAAVETVAWVRPPEPIRGLDHLDVQAPCIALYGQLLPASFATDGGRTAAAGAVGGTGAGAAECGALRSPSGFPSRRVTLPLALAPTRIRLASVDSARRQDRLLIRGSPLS